MTNNFKGLPKNQLSFRTLVINKLLVDKKLTRDPLLSRNNYAISLTLALEGLRRRDVSTSYQLAWRSRVIATLRY